MPKTIPRRLNGVPAWAEKKITRAITYTTSYAFLYYRIFEGKDLTNFAYSGREAWELPAWFIRLCEAINSVGDRSQMCEFAAQAFGRHIGDDDAKAALDEALALYALGGLVAARGYLEGMRDSGIQQNYDGMLDWMLEG